MDMETRFTAAQRPLQGGRNKMIDTEAVAVVTHDISRKNFSHQFGRSKVALKEKPIWRKLRVLGTRLWLDTGDIEEAEKLWCSDFEALTTNNTLLNNEIQKGIYDDMIHDVAETIRKATGNRIKSLI